MGAMRWLPGFQADRSAGGAAATDADEGVLLALRDLHVKYGPVAALRGISFDVAKGECVAVIGPNGAGKSSLLAAIAGVVRQSGGEILFRGRTRRSSIEDILRSGIALVPEGRHVFSAMTVHENLSLGATIRSDHAASEVDLDGMYQLFPRLMERRHQPAGRLSGGEQQQLAIARALMCRPRLLMLDEPSLGLAPVVIDQVYSVLRSLRGLGVTILLVEQNVDRAFEIADRVHVLNNGLIRLSGTREDLLSAPGFDAAYFGVSMTGTTLP